MESENPSFNCYEEINGQQAIRLRKGLRLYHVTEIVTPQLLEEFREEVEDNPNWFKAKSRLEMYERAGVGNYSTDLKRPKWFSLGRYHPLYYGNSEGFDNNPKAYLKYKTVKNITLFDGRHMNVEYFGGKYEGSMELHMYTEDIKDCLLEDPILNHCIDGWIMRDDPGEDWFEIALFRPDKVLDLHETRIFYTPEELKIYKELTPFKYSPYPFFNEDKLKIAQKIIDYGIIAVSDKDCKIYWK